MSDREYKVVYKVEVDTSGVPAELGAGGSRRVGPRHQAMLDGGDGGDGGHTVNVRRLDTDAQVISRVVRSPAYSAMVADSAMIILRRAGTNQSFNRLLGGGRQAVGAALGANPTGILNGAAGAAGGAANIIASGVGRGVGGTSGLLIGGALGLAAYGLTKAFTGLIGTVEKLSVNFAKYNAGIAASQAQVQVAQIQANIRMAQSTEPVITAFNKLKIAALGVATGWVGRASNAYGPAIEWLLGKLTSATSSLPGGKSLSDVSRNGGIGLANMAAYAAQGNSGPFNWGRARSLYGPASHTGEIVRSIYGNSPGLIASQRGLATRMLQEEELVKANYAGVSALGGEQKLTAIQRKNYNFHIHRLDSLRRQWSSMRHSLSSRFSGGRGIPVAGRALPVKYSESNLYGPFHQTRTISHNPLPHTENGDTRMLQAMGRHYKLQRELAELEKVFPARRGPETRDRIAELRRAINDPWEGSRTAMEAYMLSSRGSRDRHLGAAEVDSELRIGKQKQHIEELKRQGKISTSSPPHPSPFGMIDISQTVNFRLDMKIAHENQVDETIAQVRQLLSSGLNTARDESRLALATANLGPGGVI